MTANDIIRRLQDIVSRYSTGDIPVRRPDGSDVNIKFEDGGMWYIEMKEEK